MPEPLVCLIDAHNYIFRAFHGVPPMHAPDGTPTNAAYGFARTVLKVLREVEPDYVIALFEGRDTFRRQLDPEYKANRTAPPAPLIPQFDSSRDIALALGLTCLAEDGFEADDLIGTLATQAAERGWRVLIVSGDKDLAQLVDKHVEWLDIAKHKRLDLAAVTEHFGVRPNQVADLLALTGDPIDNIPGVAGVGAKTAAALLQVAGTVEELLAHPEWVAHAQVRGRERLRAKLIEAAPQIARAKVLATIRRDATVQLEGKTPYTGANAQAVTKVFETLGFGPRIVQEVPKWQDGGARLSTGRAPVAETGRLDL